MFMRKTLIRRAGSRLARIPYRVIFLPHYRRIFAHYGENVGWGRWYGPIIPSSIKIACPENISIGNGCQFDEYTHLLATPSSRVVIGNNVRFANGFGHVVASFDEIVIEDDCLFAAAVMIINGNHGYKDISIPIMCQASYSTGPIIIKSGCWLGKGACVMGGVTLGRNVVVGANAVVTRSVPDYCVIAGNPARIVKRYDERTKTWERDTRPTE